jgi:hypothetical protein
MEVLIVILLIILIAKEQIIELFNLIINKLKKQDKPAEIKQEVKEDGKMTPDEQFTKLMNYKFEDALEKVRTK